MNCPQSTVRAPPATAKSAVPSGPLGDYGALDDRSHGNLMPFGNPTVDQSASELQRQIAAERDGGPFLVHRDPGGEQRLTTLSGRRRLTIGRGEGVDLAIDGDDEISRLHAELELVGESWVIADDGLSTNGTRVNAERVVGRRRLSERDLISVGGTGLLFRDPARASEVPATIQAGGGEAAPPLGETQRKVLIALCRPLGDGLSHAAAPATNQAIADELFLSVNAVKAHLRVLFEKFAVGELPQNQKRVALAEQALRRGAVHPTELS